MIPFLAISDPIKLAELPRSRHKFVVVAHRGYHLHAPENSLSALQESTRVGADFMEIDLRTTKDNQIVLMHDNTVDRTTDGHGTVRSLTLADIKGLQYKNGRVEGERVPTFEEILKGANHKIGFYLDIKDVTPQQVLPWLRRYRMEKSVVVYLYANEQIDAWRAYAPQLPIIADCASDPDPDKLEANWRSHPYEISDGGAFDYTQAVVDRLHKLGVKIWPDIQNPKESPEQWSKVMALGIDGYQSDHPEDLIAYLKGLRIR